MDYGKLRKKRRRVSISSSELREKQKAVVTTKNPKSEESKGPSEDAVKVFRRKTADREGLSAKQRKEKWYFEKYLAKKEVEVKATLPSESPDIRLNKYLSMCGITSRRQADELIKEGRIKINGSTVKLLGTSVGKGDRVELDGKLLSVSEKIYILLNKPKDFISTMKDPEGRRTIADLIKEMDVDRVFPVGRLDRNTTGLIVLTNDGDLAQKLMHPSYEAKKVYLAVLNNRLKKAHKEMIAQGFNLEDGPIKVDAISYVEGAPDKKHVGIELHSGRNRIIHRIFEHFGYKVEKLDRVYYAGLTKANLLRGKWRKLTDEEVEMLKEQVKTKKSKV